MSTTIAFAFCGAVALRLASLAVSIRNKRRLKAAGAVEHGRLNSVVLALMHTAFYFACLGEGLARGAEFGRATVAGLALYAFSMIALGAVIRELGPLWTVKLIIAKDHALRTGALLRLFRHPNYFLNIVPELVAVALLCRAWYVLAFGLPVCLVPLTIRIVQEERAMRAAFAEY